MVLTVFVNWLTGLIALPFQTHFYISLTFVTVYLIILILVGLRFQKNGKPTLPFVLKFNGVLTASAGTLLVFALLFATRYTLGLILVLFTALAIVPLNAIFQLVIFKIVSFLFKHSSIKIIYLIVGFVVLACGIILTSSYYSQNLAQKSESFLCNTNIKDCAEQAIARGDSSKCDISPKMNYNASSEAGNNWQQADCLQYAVLKSFDPKFCRAMSDNKLILDMKNQCFNLTAIVLNNSQLCESMSTGTKACKDEVSKVQLISKDCSGGETKDCIASNCFSYLGHIDDSDGDSYIVSDLNKSTDRCLEKMATITGDSKLCQAIPVNEAGMFDHPEITRRDYCLGHVKSIESLQGMCPAGKKDYASCRDYYCPNIALGVWGKTGRAINYADVLASADDCFGWQYNNTKDKSWCERMTSQREKQWCLNLR